MPKQHSLDALLLDVRNGNIRALESLCAEIRIFARKYFALRVRNREQVQDLTQELMLWFAQHTQDIEKPESLRAFVTSKMIFLIKNQYASNRRNTRVVVDSDLLRNDHGSQPAFELDPGRIMDLHKALEKLPASLRAPLEMRYLEDLDYPEIAEKLQITEDATRKRLSRAMTLMKLFLE